MDYNKLIYNLSSMSIYELNDSDTLWRLPCFKGGSVKGYSIDDGEYLRVIGKYSNQYFVARLSGNTWNVSFSKESHDYKDLYYAVSEFKKHNCYSLPDSIPLAVNLLLFKFSDMRVIHSTIMPTDVLPKATSYTILKTSGTVAIVKCDNNFYLYNEKDRWVQKVTEEANISLLLTITAWHTSIERSITEWLRTENNSTYQKLIELQEGSDSYEFLEIFKKVGGDL